MQYLNEFITIALVHLVAVASPGPDFAVVVRHSVAYGRRIAIYTSVGIGFAILLHVVMRFPKTFMKLHVFMEGETDLGTSNAGLASSRPRRPIVGPVQACKLRNMPMV